MVRRRMRGKKRGGKGEVGNMEKQVTKYALAMNQVPLLVTELDSQGPKSLT